eukprot:16443-Heterococcus_DN1.PRE.2
MSNYQHSTFANKAQMRIAGAGRSVRCGAKTLIQKKVLFASHAHWRDLGDVSQVNGRFCFCSPVAV